MQFLFSAGMDKEMRREEIGERMEKGKGGVGVRREREPEVRGGSAVKACETRGRSFLTVRIVGGCDDQEKKPLTVKFSILQHL